MVKPLVLRGLVAVADRALNPEAVANNAGRAAEDLARRMRDQAEVNISLLTGGGGRRRDELPRPPRHRPQAPTARARRVTGTQGSQRPSPN